MINVATRFVLVKSTLTSYLELFSHLPYSLHPSGQATESHWTSVHLRIGIWITPSNKRKNDFNDDHDFPFIPSFGKFSKTILLLSDSLRTWGGSVRWISQIWFFFLITKISRELTYKLGVILTFLTRRSVLNPLLLKRLNLIPPAFHNSSKGGPSRGAAISLEPEAWRIIVTDTTQTERAG